MARHLMMRPVYRICSRFLRVILFILLLPIPSLALIEVGQCSDGTPANMPCDQESQTCLGDPNMGCERHGPAYFCCGTIPADKGTSNGTGIIQYSYAPAVDSSIDPTGCDDKFHQCDHWAKRGLCFMNMYTSQTKASLCPKSCKLCHLLPPAPGQENQGTPRVRENSDERGLKGSKINTNSNSVNPNHNMNQMENSSPKSTINPSPSTPGNAAGGAVGLVNSIWNTLTGNETKENAGNNSTSTGTTKVPTMTTILMESMGNSTAEPPGLINSIWNTLTDHKKPIVMDNGTIIAPSSLLGERTENSGTSQSPLSSILPSSSRASAGTTTTPDWSKLMNEDDDDPTLNGKDFDYSLLDDLPESSENLTKSTSSSASSLSISPAVPPSNPSMAVEGMESSPAAGIGKKKVPKKLSPEEGELIHAKNEEDRRRREGGGKKQIKKMDDEEEEGIEEKDSGIKRAKEERKKKRRSQNEKKEAKKKKKDEKEKNKEARKKKDDDSEKNKEEGKHEAKNKHHGKKKKGKYVGNVNELEEEGDDYDDYDEDEGDYEDDEEDDARKAYWRNYWQQFRRGMHGIRDNVRASRNNNWANNFRQGMHNTMRQLK